jgi:dihydroflavonol-4-reductase
MVHVSSVDALDWGSPAAPADEECPPKTGVLCPYVVTKREAEQVVLDQVGRGLNASIVNPGYMLGPWDWKPSSGRMLLQVARGFALCAPLGTNNYCDVRDVAAGILSAAERGQSGRRYILAGENLTYFQAWRIFAKITRKMPPLLPAGPLLRIGAGAAGDLWTKLTGREPDINSAATAIAAHKRNFSSRRAQEELGYQPRPMAEAAQAAWEWFKAHGYA